LYNIMNLILQQGNFRLFWGPRQIFVTNRNVAFKTVKTNNNTIIIFKSINLLLTVFGIGNKMKEPCISIPFLESFDLSPLSHLILQGKPNASHMCARINLHTHDR
jgi:hypothetical protein